MAANVGNDNVEVRGRTVSAGDVAQVLGNTGSWLGRVVAQVRLSWSLGGWVSKESLAHEIRRGGSSQNAADTVRRICSAYLATKVGSSATVHTPQITELLRRIGGFHSQDFNRTPELVSLLSGMICQEFFLDNGRCSVKLNGSGGITIQEERSGEGVSLSRSGAKISQLYEDGHFEGLDVGKDDGSELLKRNSPILWKALQAARDISIINEVLSRAASVKDRSCECDCNGRRLMISKRGNHIAFRWEDESFPLANIIDGKLHCYNYSLGVDFNTLPGRRALSSVGEGVIAAGLEKLIE